LPLKVLWMIVRVALLELPLPSLIMPPPNATPELPV
jgi:hypothetical protein